MEKKLLQVKFIEDIACTGCAMDMESIMLAVNGVEEATVNYKEGTLAIKYDPGKIEAETIVKKVKKLGLKTKLVTDET